jgi:hypothetical protein
MPNTSATGGYLQPQATPIVTEDATLRAFLHDVISAITGLSSDKVRQAWQASPAPTPGIDVDWSAFAVVQQVADFDSYQGEHLTGSTMALLRHETVEVLCTFYGPNCQSYAARLVDGMYLSQNRDVMRSVGVGSFDFSPIVHAPELFNDRYIERVDVTMTLRREIRRDYPILSLLAADGILQTETVSQQWVTDPQGVIP